MLGSQFVAAESAWTFAFVMSWILFVSYGVTAIAEYGYQDDKFHLNGSIPSGPSGSGVFIITLMLTISSTATYFAKAVRAHKRRTLPCSHTTPSPRSWSAGWPSLPFGLKIECGAADRILYPMHMPCNPGAARIARDVHC